MIHGLAALGKLDDFVWTPKVLIRDQVIRSCIMNNDDSQTFKNTIGIKVQNMKMDFDVGGTWHWTKQGKLIMKINDFLNLSKVIIKQ